MAREKAAYRDVLEMLNEAFPGIDVLTMIEVSDYLRMDRRTLLQDDEFPANGPPDVVTGRRVSGGEGRGEVFNSQSAACPLVGGVIEKERFYV